MLNKEASFEKDPQLRRNDSPAQKSTGAAGNKWTEAMKGIPSYSEHMKQVNAGSAANQNAFKQATESKATTTSQSNAFSRISHPGQNSSCNVSNNAFKSASNTTSKTSSSTGQSISAGRGQSASRSK